MTMLMKIAAGEFKARCLRLLDEVSEGGGELVITKRGRPVARLVPVDDDPSLHGSVTYNVSDEELLAPIEADWDADPAR